AHVIGAFLVPVTLHYWPCFRIGWTALAVGWARTLLRCLCRGLFAEALSKRLASFRETLTAPLESRIWAPSTFWTLFYPPLRTGFERHWVNLPRRNGSAGPLFVQNKIRSFSRLPVPAKRSQRFWPAWIISGGSPTCRVAFRSSTFHP